MSTSSPRISPRRNGITSLDGPEEDREHLNSGRPPELEQAEVRTPGLGRSTAPSSKSAAPYAKYPPKISDLDAIKIQVATFFTTDAVISEKGYVQLKDPQSMILPQNVIPLVRSDVADNANAVARWMRFRRR
jgi:osmoprotectant transport system substrate-binding protein